MAERWAEAPDGTVTARFTDDTETVVARAPVETMKQRLAQRADLEARIEAYMTCNSDIGAYVLEAGRVEALVEDLIAAGWRKVT